MDDQTSPEILRLLSQANLFSGLTEAHLQRLVGIGKEECFRKGEVVFKQGDPGDKFYLVLEGKVRISRTVPGLGEEALTVLGAGQGFGEMSLIDDAPRSADALAHESCRLFVVVKEDLEDLLYVDRDLAYPILWKMVHLLSARLRETNDKLTFLSAANKFE